MPAKDIPVDGFANPYSSMYEDYLWQIEYFRGFIPKAFGIHRRAIARE